MQKLEELKYPIGTYQIPKNITEKQLADWIVVLEQLPERLEALVAPLNEEQLACPYRPDGWTVRQVVHHMADSHHHSYIRFKWALTEDNPTIKPYFEKEWAALFDTRTAPISLSIAHLKAVHAKLVYLLRGLSQEQMSRTFVHPDGNQKSTLAENVGRYAWHGTHHFSHIKNLIDRMGW